MFYVDFEKKPLKNSLISVFFHCIEEWFQIIRQCVHISIYVWTLIHFASAQCSAGSTINVQARFFFVFNDFVSMGNLCQCAWRSCEQSLIDKMFDEGSRDPISSKNQQKYCKIAEIWTTSDRWKWCFVGNIASLICPFFFFLLTNALTMYSCTQVNKARLEFDLTIKVKVIISILRS